LLPKPDKEGVLADAEPKPEEGADPNPLDGVDGVEPKPEEGTPDALFPNRPVGAAEVGPAPKPEGLEGVEAAPNPEEVPVALAPPNPDEEADPNPLEAVLGVAGLPNPEAPVEDVEEAPPKSPEGAGEAETGVDPPNMPVGALVGVGAAPNPEAVVEAEDAEPNPLEEGMPVAEEPNPEGDPAGFAPKPLDDAAAVGLAPKPLGAGLAAEGAEKRPPVVGVVEEDGLAPNRPDGAGEVAADGLAPNEGVEDAGVGAGVAPNVGVPVGLELVGLAPTTKVPFVVIGAAAGDAEALGDEKRPPGTAEEVGLAPKEGVEDAAGVAGLKAGILGAVVLVVVVEAAPPNLNAPAAVAGAEASALVVVEASAESVEAAGLAPNNGVLVAPAVAAGAPKFGILGAPELGTLKRGAGVAVEASLPSSPSFLSAEADGEEMGLNPPNLGAEEVAVVGAVRSDVAEAVEGVTAAAAAADFKLNWRACFSFSFSSSCLFLVSLSSFF
jgi:hypothetical protein